MRGLEGKRIVVGGGAAGIGASLVQTLLNEGAYVLVGDVNESALNGARNNWTIGHGKATAATFDLGDQNSIEALIRTCITTYGGMDGVAVVGADLSAATLGNDRNILQMDAKVWIRTLTVNLVGHALLMSAAVPHLMAAGGGSIVTVSSANAYFGAPEIPAYSASKAGLHALVRHVARLCGPHHIRCNAVAPGLVMTDGARINMTDALLNRALENNALPRHGEPSDIASAIAFLLSDESSWVTGQVISINGGFLFRD